MLGYDNGFIQEVYVTGKFIHRPFILNCEPLFKTICEIASIKTILKRKNMFRLCSKSMFYLFIFQQFAGLVIRTRIEHRQNVKSHVLPLQDYRLWS